MGTRFKLKIYPSNPHSPSRDWFYKSIIKESDSFMRFFYSAFAFSMFIVFYLTGILLFIGKRANIKIFEWNFYRFIFMAFSIILICLSFFFVNRIYFEKEIKMRQKSSYLDTFVIIYILFSFIIFYINALNIRE